MERDDMNDKIIFRGKELDYLCDWLDHITFRFEFGVGVFTDSEGDDYFIHCEYHADDDRFIFEAWFEYDYINIKDKPEYITEKEMEYIKDIMKQKILAV